MATTREPSDHTDSHPIIIHCDGLCEPINPSGFGCWGWVAFHNGHPIARDHGCLGHGHGITNNRCEYATVIYALQWLYGYRERIHARGLHIILRTDSKLVVEQLNGRWSCNAPALQPFYNDARRLMLLTRATIVWIPREENTDADSLCRVAFLETRQAHAATQRKVGGVAC